LPDRAVAPVKAAKHIRNYLLVRILVATALRSRNIRELTYREDNTGHLRRKGDKWVILIPYQRFKNRNSSFFGGKKKRSDYERELADKDGLYEWIEEYIAVHRPVLLGGKPSDIFFVCSLSNPVMDHGDLSKIYRRLTMIYFAHNPFVGRGVPGVRPHGPHAVRDVLATFVIQITGSYELAAYMIGDSRRTVEEHYARFMPKDKMRLVDMLVNSAWDGQSGEDSPAAKVLRELLKGHFGMSDV
jgi:integrase